MMITIDEERTMRTEKSGSYASAIQNMHTTFASKSHQPLVGQQTMSINDATKKLNVFNCCLFICAVYKNKRE